jgi:hypothetical protein
MQIPINQRAIEALQLKNHDGDFGNSGYNYTAE